MKKAADLEAFRTAVHDTLDKYSAAMNAEDSDLWIYGTRTGYRCPQMPLRSSEKQP